MEHPYFGGSFLAAGLGIWLLSVRRRARIYIGGMALLGIASLGFGAYFRRFGIWNSLTPIAFVGTPYATILVATVLRPIRVRSLGVPFRLATVLACLAVIGGFFVTKRAAPDSAD